MKLPQEKLEEIEYYECYEKKQGTKGKFGPTVIYDKVVLHYGEFKKEWKLFGKWTIWTETVQDRTETLTFEWFRSPSEEEDMYKYKQDEEFVELRNQLRYWFDAGIKDLYQKFQKHEIEYIKDS